MLPRGILDIGWADLGFALRASARGGDRAEAQARVEAAWSADGDALCALSVRSGLDLLLTALELPPGGEVLTSAMTIEDVPRIIAQHGLVAVPVDLDMHTLSVTVAALHKAVSERTCAVLVAHLFGSRMPLGAVAAFAHQHSLLLIEDCAQAYSGPDFTGHPDSDVSMFSFGPIKTNTALGGAVLRLKDPALLDTMRAVQSRQPVQGNEEFRRRVVKYAGLKMASRPAIFGAGAGACRMFGTTHDAVISKALHGFSGPRFFDRIQRQPSYPLLALLERRLQTFDSGRVQRRRQTAESARASLPATTEIGAGAPRHTHWVFPIASSAPDELTRHLWARGFDATRGASSLAVLSAPHDHPDLAATDAAHALSRMVYLPVHLGASPSQLARLIRTVSDFEATRTS